MLAGRPGGQGASPSEKKRQMTPPSDPYSLLLSVENHIISIFTQDAFLGRIGKEASLRDSNFVPRRLWTFSLKKK